MRPAALMRGASRKPTSRGTRRAIQRQLRHLHQRAQAGLHRIPQLAQTKPNDSPVFTSQRHRVGDRGNRHQLQKTRQDDVPQAPLLLRRARGRFKQSLSQFERDAPLHTEICLGTGSLAAPD